MAWYLIRRGKDSSSVKVADWSLRSVPTLLPTQSGICKRLMGFYLFLKKGDNEFKKIMLLKNLHWKILPKKEKFKGTDFVIYREL